MKKEMWERDGKRDGETRVNIKDSQLNYSPSAISTDLISGWFMQKSAFVALFFPLNPSNSASPREWTLPMVSAGCLSKSVKSQLSRGLTEVQ